MTRKLVGSERSHPPVLPVVLLGMLAAVGGGLREAAAAPAPAPTVAPAPAVAPAPTEVWKQLAALGLRRLKQLRPAAVANAVPQKQRPEIPVLDRAGASCVRPTKAEQAALRKAVAADDALATGDSLSLRFGCVEPMGVVVDVSYEHGQRGVWKVVRASSTAPDARVTTLSRIAGTATDYWMEWVNEATLHTMVLVDLDNDGTRDPLIALNEHEGGAMSNHVTLSIWLSLPEKLLQLGQIQDYVGVLEQPWISGGALVLTIDREFPPAPRRYRCVNQAGRLDLCRAITEARRFDRAIAIASGLTQRLTYPALDPWEDLSTDDGGSDRTSTELPDRDRLDLLLRDVGATPAERARLVAMVAPTAPEVRVAREIALALQQVELPTRPRKFGELVEPAPVDPRHRELNALLGDDTCPTTTAKRATITAQLKRWATANTAALIAQHGACKAGEPCGWGKPTKVEISSACTLGKRGHYGARVSYVDQGGLLAIDALFYVDGAAVKMVTSASEIGDAAECSACAGPPEEQLELALFRRGTQLLAIGRSAIPSQGGNSKLTVAVDGALAVNQDSYYTDARYRFADQLLAGPPFASVLQVSSSTGDTLTFWHWDQKWAPLTTIHVPISTQATPPPGTNAAAHWLWRQQQRNDAMASLREFSAMQWARSAAYREDAQRALALVGAEAAMRARVAEAARAIK